MKTIALQTNGENELDSTSIAFIKIGPSTTKVMLRYRQILADIRSGGGRVASLTVSECNRIFVREVKHIDGGDKIHADVCESGDYIILDDDTFIDENKALDIRTTADEAVFTESGVSWRFSSYYGSGVWATTAEVPWDTIVKIDSDDRMPVNSRKTKRS